jgi:hypothetical protein
MIGVCIDYVKYIDAVGANLEHEEGRKGYKKGGGIPWNQLRR